jgi:hypothetical protein
MLVREHPVLLGVQVWEAAAEVLVQPVGLEALVGQHLLLFGGHKETHMTEHIEWRGINIPREGDVPTRCTPRQGWEAMEDDEHTRIMAVVSQLPPRKRAAFEASNEWDATHPDFLLIMTLAGISPQRKDDLMRIAVRIE